MKNKSLILICIASLLLTACEQRIVDSDMGESNITEEQCDGVITLSSGVRLSKVGANYFFQDDILLTSEQVKLLGQPATRSGYLTDLSKRWSSNLVYYSIASDFQKKAELQNAIEHWSERTNLRFSLRTNQSNYIEFVNDPTSCYSNMGMIGGRQEIHIASWAYMGDIAHEIGHAVGLVHEQCRPDRDEYITVFYDNIQKDKWHNFDKFTSGVAVTTPFDFNSLMIYPSSGGGFAIDPTLPAMAKKDGSMFGKQYSLSAGDVEAINTKMYLGEKYRISGEPTLSIPTQANYSISGVPSGATVVWSINPANAATIVSGQGTSNLCISVNSNAISFIKAAIQFKSGYVRYTPDFNIAASRMPLVKDIEMNKIGGQMSGEYTLKAIVNDQNATCTWASGNGARLYDVLYPGDAEYGGYSNLFKAVDFYNTGLHDITVFASNSYGSSSFSKSIYVNDAKGYFAFSISPNPVLKGGAININVSSENIMRKRETYDIFIYKGKELVSQFKTNESQMQLMLPALEKGRYVVTITNGSLKCHQVMYIE